MTRCNSLALCILLVSGLVMQSSRAEDSLEQAAGRVVTASQDAVVWVSATMKTSGGYRRWESKSEVLGTVVHPSGCTVVSASDLGLSPTDELNSGEVSDDEFSRRYRMYYKENAADLKIILGDGSEVPAKLVLYDQDVGLAILIPSRLTGTNVAKRFTFINMDTGADAKLLEQVLCVSRLAKSGNRQPHAKFSRVASVVTKPRKRFILADPGDEGTPLLNLSGQALGIFVAADGENRDYRQGVLPAEDVMDLVKQALGQREHVEPVSSEDRPASTDRASQ